MRLGQRLFTALALCLATAASAAAQQAGTITGRVTDTETGSPLVGVNVEVVSAANRVVATALSDQQGNFRVANVPSGTYTVQFKLVGYSTSSIPEVRVTAGETAMVGTTLSTSAFQLNPVVISASKRTEKAIEAPAAVAVVGKEEIERRPTVTPVDHLRNRAGVDIVTYGVQSTAVVTRGFGNVFSGSLHTLTDHRIASVPSLRVNLMHFLPTTNEDIERIEVVLGPGSALYGPNTSNGVMHIMTQSPLTSQGTSLSVTGGERSLLHLSGRTAHKLTDAFGIKLSGQYLQANEWEYTDSVELAERRKFDNQTGPLSGAFFRQDMIRATGLSTAEVDRRIGLIGNRDFDVKRFSGEARADWNFADNGTAVFSAGLTNIGAGIELTGLGAGQAKDWTYSYYQARANYGRLFGQVYLNASDAGDTYLLRNGFPITDKSRLTVAELQHGLSVWSGRQNFTYGVDYQKIDPRTGGTINGRYENDDETTQIGAYLQSETALSSKFDLVLAGRYDDHSGIPDGLFSPRAGIVFKPATDHAFRATYNKSYSTPTSLNQFLDIASSAPSTSAAQLGYSLRVQGTGTTGFRFRQTGGFQMRSPFTPAAAGGPATLVPANAAAYFQAALQVVAAQAAARGQAIPQSVLTALAGTPAASLATVGTMFLPVTGGDPRPISELVINDVPPIRESENEAIEFGYKGILGGRLLLAADVWFENRSGFTTPLTQLTPLLLMNGQALGAVIAQRLIAAGFPAAQAQATAASLAPGLASVPVGVISSADVSATGAQLLFSYTNVDDEFSVNGVDLAATALLSDVWSVGATASFVNKDVFTTDRGESVTLNAPKRKGSATLAYANTRIGLTGEFRARYNDEFPVRSGVYNGTLCIGGKELGAEPCVDSYTLLDFNIGYKIPGVRGASIHAMINNLLDEDYRSFPGVPSIGRMALLRLKYDF